MVTVKELRISRDWTSTQMAKELELTQGVYSDKERGRRKFQPFEIIKICQMFDVRVENIKDFYTQDSRNKIGRDTPSTA